jgi:hypothetical protein
MDFSRITLNDWQQFSQVEINFHPRATILTGANSSGKTTILGMLARHRGWQPWSLATPKNDRTTNALRYYPLSRSWARPENPDRMIGLLTYSNGVVSPLVVPEAASAQYQVQVLNQQPARFFYIPSHRQTFSYRRVGQISTVRKEKNTAFEEIHNNQLHRHSGNQVEPSSLIMKNTLLGWVVNGYGVHNGDKVVMPRDPVQIKNFEGFRDVLRLILPKSLGFQDLEVRDYEIIFVCNNGEDEFLLETASGGVSSLIDIAWQIYMFDTDSNEPFCVVIDEVENHLHPSMQRTLLPNLLAAFPHAKFIVSTHSPLVVTSVEDANVYALRYDENNKVKSHLLDFKNEVKNAVEILDEVLGVSTTLPAWAVDKLSYILQKHCNTDPTAQSLAILRSELNSAGLGNLFPRAIESIAEARK